MAESVTQTRLVRGAWVGMITAVLGVACGDSGPGHQEAVGTSASADSMECNAGPYVDGVDVYDGSGTIDWAAVKASGVGFAIIKATQGNYDTQTNFATNWAGAKAAGVLRSAYHFFDPTIDGVAQANWFLKVMGALEPGDLPPTLDIECPDGDANCLGTGSGGDETGSVITTRMNDWLHTVRAATGMAPFVYSFESYFSSNGVDTTGLDAYPLYIAYPTTATCFGIPSPWTSAAVWQNSWNGTVNGISGGVDTDRFLGSLAQLQALAGGYVAPSQLNGNRVLTAINWSDGHVELFAATNKGGAVHLYTTGSGDTWSAPQPLEGTATCGLASLAFANPGATPPALFDALPDGDVEGLHYTPTAWTPFAKEGTNGLSQISTLAFADGHAALFAMHDDGAIWTTLWDPKSGSWSSWSSLGGTFATGAAPILWSDGHAQIFATDASGVAFTATTTKGAFSWGGWQKMQGPKLATRPIPARWADGSVEVFARGDDDILYASYATKGDFPPFVAKNAGNKIQGEPQVVVYPAYGPEVFARDPKGELIHAWYASGTLSAWANDFHETLASDPFVWLRPDGQAEVFGVDAKGGLVKSLHNGPTWSAFTTLATGIDACDARPKPPPPDAGTGHADAGKDGGAPDASGALWDSGGGGCSCRAAGRSGTAGLGGAGGALLAVGAMLRRFRRRARPPRVFDAGHGSPRRT